MDVLLAVGVLAVALPSLYLYAASMAAARFPTLRNKRICLLIAHPDDEAMFFAPTVVALTRRETGNHVKILCLSSGNANGLGETRKKELVLSGLELGLRTRDDVFVVDRPEDFPDSMTTPWDAAKIATLLSDAFAPHLPTDQTTTTTTTTTTSPEAAAATSPANIDVLITFDAHGVSGHPNHTSLYHGATRFVSSLEEKQAPPVALYTLTSVSLARKFLSVLDAAATLATAQPAGLVFLSGGGAVATAWRAMTDAHKSQMVWFRWLWILFSRYMLMNDLRRR